jgi:hypothetical protein
VLDGGCPISEALVVFCEPLLSEPGAGPLRTAVNAARVGHNHWALRRLTDELDANGGKRELRAHLEEVVERYEPHTNSPPHAAAVRSAYDVAADTARSRKLTSAGSGCGSGVVPDVGGCTGEDTPRVARFLLQHQHAPGECRAVFAAWRGHGSPLRHRPTVASCVFGGHAIWWTVEADSEGSALTLLPKYVADRTDAIRVSEVEIP